MFGLTESNDKAKFNLDEEIIRGKTLLCFCFYDLVKSCCREKVYSWSCYHNQWKPKMLW
jgi:hypothetical protein